jgi:hypothetical protein
MRTQIVQGWSAETRNFLGGCEEIVRLGSSNFLKVRKDSFWGIYSLKSEKSVVPFTMASIRWMFADYYEVQTMNDKRGVFSTEKGRLVVPAVFSFIRPTLRSDDFVVWQSGQRRKFSIRKGGFV